MEKSRCVVMMMRRLRGKIGQPQPLGYAWPQRHPISRYDLATDATTQSVKHTLTAFIFIFTYIYRCRSLNFSTFSHHFKLYSDKGSTEIICFSVYIRSVHALKSFIYARRSTVKLSRILDGDFIRLWDI